MEQHFPEYLHLFNYSHVICQSLILMEICGLWVQYIKILGLMEIHIPYISLMARNGTIIARQNQSLIMVVALLLFKVMVKYGSPLLITGHTCIMEHRGSNTKLQYLP